MENLIQHISQHIKVNELQLHTILSKFKLRKLPKGRHFLKQGQIAGEYLFLEEGCLRIYYFRDDKEITGWATTHHYLFTDLISLNRQTPSVFNIQAIEKSTLYCISKKNMDELYATIPAWQEFGRKIWEMAFMDVLQMIVSYQIETAEERYERLLEEPELLKKVPLKHLATFIGITPNSLSRIRKEKSKK